MLPRLKGICHLSGFVPDYTNIVLEYGTWLDGKIYAENFLTTQVGPWDFYVQTITLRQSFARKS